jgi:hypothetical protein
MYKTTENERQDLLHALREQKRGESVEPPRHVLQSSLAVIPSSSNRWDYGRG